MDCQAIQKGGAFPVVFFAIGFEFHTGRKPINSQLINNNLHITRCLEKVLMQQTNFVVSLFFYTHQLVHERRL